MTNIDPIEAVLEHVGKTGKITNRECRELLNTSYDKSVFLLSGICNLGLLSRRGASSSTHYVLSDSDPIKEGFDELRENLLKRFI
jgi:predicted HTH transcriptional regulator